MQGGLENLPRSNASNRHFASDRADSDRGSDVKTFGKPALPFARATDRIHPVANLPD
jgi:hypothetical protein